MNTFRYLAYGHIKGGKTFVCVCPVKMCMFSRKERREDRQAWVERWLVRYKEVGTMRQAGSNKTDEHRQEGGGEGSSLQQTYPRIRGKYHGDRSLHPQY